MVCHYFIINPKDKKNDILIDSELQDYWRAINGSPKSNRITILMNAIYISVALYSIIFAQRRLSREGVSKKMRKLFIFLRIFFCAFLCFHNFFSATLALKWILNPIFKLEDYCGWCLWSPFVCILASLQIVKLINCNEVN